jgi:hypothetical protein
MQARKEGAAHHSQIGLHITSNTQKSPLVIKAKGFI